VEPKNLLPSIRRGTIVKIEKTSCDSWDQLMLTIDNDFRCHKEYIFRGQADAKWKLETTLNRAFKKNSFLKKDYSSYAKEYFTSFKQNIRGRVSVTYNPLNNDEIWSIGQHHGLYTPLMDWTFSPYVAIFFALQGESPSGTRSIWALESTVIDKINKEDAQNIQLEIINPQGNENHRLISQRGLFLKLENGSTVEKMV